MGTDHGVTMHSDGFRPGNPAVNVKVHSYRWFDETVKALVERGVPEDVANEAAETAYDIHKNWFWEGVDEIAKWELWTNRHTERASFWGFTSDYKIYQEGRSGGWLVVHGLPHPEEWTKAQRIRWSRFEDAIAAEVEHYTDPDHLLETIDSNEIVENITRRDRIDSMVKAYRAELEAQP